MNYGNPYAPQHQDAQYNQRRHPDDNVSAPAPDHSGDEHTTFASARGGSRPLLAHDVNLHTNQNSDRISSPEAPSPAPSTEKTVKFDLNPQEEPSRGSSPKGEKEEEHDHGHRRHRRRKDDERSNSTRESGRDSKRHRRDESPGSDVSEATIDLPPRFDEQGRRRPEDPLADKLESVLHTLFR